MYNYAIFNEKFSPEFTNLKIYYCISHKMC